jgi:quercetin dioxygenase-like cupin family protein
LGGRFTVKTSGDDSQGRLAALEVLITPAAEPPLHIHHREDEAFFIIDGAMTFHAGDEVIEATTGCFVFAPMGIPHAFRVDVDPTRVLLFAAPAGFERFARELGIPATGDEPPAGLSLPDPVTFAEVGERFGIEFVGPPIRAMG